MVLRRTAACDLWSDDLRQRPCRFITRSGDRIGEPARADLVGRGAGSGRGGVLHRVSPAAVSPECEDILREGTNIMAALDWSQCPAVESISGKVSGTWVLRGTRTPVKVLFENLEAGMSIEELMDNSRSPASRLTA